MVNNECGSFVWDMAKKAVEHKNTHWGSRSLHRLGLGRAVHPADAGSRYRFYDHHQSSLPDPDLLYIEITDERGI